MQEEAAKAEATPVEVEMAEATVPEEGSAGTVLLAVVMVAITRLPHSRQER